MHSIVCIVLICILRLASALGDLQSSPLLRFLSILRVEYGSKLICTRATVMCQWASYVDLALSSTPTKFAARSFRIPAREFFRKTTLASEVFHSLTLPVRHSLFTKNIILWSAFFRIFFRMCFFGSVWFYHRAEIFCAIFFHSVFVWILYMYSTRQKILELQLKTYKYIHV